MINALSIIIPNIIVGLIQIFLFYKLYKTAEALIEEGSEYLKQLTETYIEIIKKSMEHRQ